jgi:hypothetical protein
MMYNKCKLLNYRVENIFDRYSFIYAFYFSLHNQYGVFWKISGVKQKKTQKILILLLH